MEQRFEVLDKLGEGSMGVVYEAYDRERDMVVALKTLRYLDASSLYRFKREFRTLADLSHPNLVSLYELIHQDERWYLSMELVRGMDLMSYLHPDVGFDDEEDITGTGLRTMPRPRTESEPVTMDLDHGEGTADWPVQGSLGPLVCPVAEIVDIERLRRVMGELAKGLHALHRAGLVHRDLKPENVRITDEGRVVLMDFGLVIELSQWRTASGRVAIAGTPAYMAPEQLDRLRPTAAADWYAFGTLLFEAMTTSLPFSGLPSDVLAAKRERDAPDLDTLVCDVPDDLRAICHGLLARDPAARLTGEQVLERLGVEPEPIMAEPYEVRRSRSFIGRQHELECLRRAYAAVAGGQGRYVFIEGPPGMGKTQLVETFIDRVYQESDDASMPFVLSSWCHERETLLYKALDGVVDDISQFLRMLPDDERNAFIPENMVFLSRLFPVLVRVPTGAMPMRLSPQSLDEQRERAITALRSLLTRMAAQRPVVIRIESLQWADEDSMELIGQLFGPAPIPGVLLLLTSRPPRSSRTELGAVALEETLGTLERHAEFVHLSLAPLSEDEQRRMVEALTAHPELLAQVHDSQWRAMGGHPLLLIELARYLDELGSSHLAPGSDQAPTLLHVIERHIERIPEDARTMLDALAVLGESTPIRTLQQAASLSGERAEKAANILVLNTLARVTRVENGLWLDCHHDKIRQVVVHSLSGERRRALHRWVAHILGQRAQVEHAAVARHFEAAEAHEDACEHLLLAAQVAHEKLSTTRAARLYRHVIERLSAEELTARGARLVCRARIGLVGDMLLVAQRQEALDELSRAQVLATRFGLVEELSEIHRSRGNLLFPMGEVEACRAEHEQALEFAHRAASPILTVRALSGVADAFYLAGRMRSAHEHYDACVEQARAHGLLADELANTVMRGWTGYFDNHLEAALDDSRLAVARGSEAGCTRACVLARCGVLGVLLVDQDRADEALEELQDGLGLARTMGVPRFEVHALMCTGMALYACGRRDAALAAAEEALALSQETCMAFSGPWVLGVLARICGDAGRSRALIARGSELLESNEIGHNHLFFHREAMEFFLAQGDAERVEDHAVALERFVANEPLPWARFFIERARALARVMVGAGVMADENRADIRALAQDSRRWGFVAAARALEAHSS